MITHLFSVCQPGTYIDGDECPDCAKGTFSITERSTQCDDCPANSYNGHAGATVCTQCPTGETSPPKSIDHHACIRGEELLIWVGTFSEF